MSRQAYIVTNGEPDDLFIVGVYTSKSRAQNAADRVAGYVENFELNLLPVGVCAN
jgi:hypothetical protein